MKKAIILYMPVIHQGYLAFLERHLPADVFLVSAESIAEIDPTISGQLSRDIRAVPRKTIRELLWYLYEADKEPVLSRIRNFNGIDDLKEYGYSDIVMPDEDLSHVLQKHLSWATVEFDTAFLRYDWSASTQVKNVNGTFPVSTDENNRFIMDIVENYAGKSSDVWRHVGAAVMLSGVETMYASHNEHMPHPHSPYINGDMRLSMNPGERPDICGAIHAEVNLIARAAKEGKSLDGLAMYVTTFPCAPCARAIVKAGIKTIFYREGYSNIDAIDVLTKAEIAVFQVK